MKLFAFAASLRAESINQRLVELAAGMARDAGAEVTVVDFAEICPPLYNADDQSADGFPAEAERLKQLLDDHDGFLLASPEYNYSFPGSLKNAIDWVSRYRPVPTRGKCAYLLSAAPGVVGGNRGLWHLRQPLACIGVHVYPGMFSLARARDAYAEDGSLADEGMADRLRSDLTAFIQEGIGAAQFK